MSLLLGSTCHSSSAFQCQFAHPLRAAPLRRQSQFIASSSYNAPCTAVSDHNRLKPHGPLVWFAFRPAGCPAHANGTEPPLWLGPGSPASAASPPRGRRVREPAVPVAHGGGAASSRHHPAGAFILCPCYVHTHTHARTVAFTVCSSWCCSSRCSALCSSGAGLAS